MNPPPEPVLSQDTHEPETQTNFLLGWQIRQLSYHPENIQILSHYLTRTSLERRISDAGDRAPPDYRPEWQESLSAPQEFCLKYIDS
jgi:hypothetical protein